MLLKILLTVSATLLGVGLANSPLRKLKFFNIK